MKPERIQPNGTANIWQSVVAGFMIGIGGILPGVSGGILAVSFGLYRPMLDAVANLFKDTKKSLLFLLPIGAGAALGFFLGSVALHRIIQSYYNEIMYLFVGLVVGGIPSFLQEANSKGFKKRWLAATIVGAVAASSLLLIKNGAEVAEEAAYLTLWQSLLTGFILSVGVVIPGISTSFMLMYLGWYRPAMAAVANMDIISLLLMGVGVVSCSLILIKGVRWTFSHFRGYSYYAVLGFLIVSVALIFPGFSLDVAHVSDIVLMSGGFALAYLMGKMIGKT